MKWLFLALPLTFCDVARTADKDGAYQLMGMRSCWDYIVSRVDTRAVEHALVSSWIGGYITAYNRQTPDTLGILGKTDLDGALRWLDSWCAAHPRGNMGEAMIALTNDFYRRRYKTVKDAAP